MAITMTRSQYDSLCALAKTADPSAATSLQRSIDSSNGITRYFLYVRWQNVGGVPPKRIELGKGWPPEQTYQLELERPIAREDVDDVLRNNATNPASVMVTPDRFGIVGWTFVDDYNFSVGA